MDEGVWFHLADSRCGRGTSILVGSHPLSLLSEAPCRPPAVQTDILMTVDPKACPFPTLTVWIPR